MSEMLKNRIIAANADTIMKIPGKIVYKLRAYYPPPMGVWIRVRLHEVTTIYLERCFAARCIK